MKRLVRWFAALIPARSRSEMARMTDNARAVFRRAEERARAEGGVLEAQHILRGLAAHRAGVAVVVLLHEVEIPIDRIAELLPLAPVASERSAEVVWSDSVRALVEQARAESESLAHPYVGTEHLLLALARIDSGVVADVFGRLGIRYEVVRRGVCELLGVKSNVT
jgi:ATP-dependent Clp protease ATP-binding subunit ClpC